MIFLGVSCRKIIWVGSFLLGIFQKEKVDTYNYAWGINKRNLHGFTWGFALGCLVMIQKMLFPRDLEIILLEVKILDKSAWAADFGNFFFDGALENLFCLGICLEGTIWETPPAVFVQAGTGFFRS